MRGIGAQGDQSVQCKRGVEVYQVTRGGEVYQDTRGGLPEVFVFVVNAHTGGSLG